MLDHANDHNSLNAAEGVRSDADGVGDLIEWVSLTQNGNILINVIEVDLEKKDIQRYYTICASDKSTDSCLDY